MIGEGLPAARTGNRLGVVAVWLAIVVVVLMLISRIAGVLAPLLSYRWHLPFSAIDAAISGLGWIGIAVALAAIVVGALGLRRGAAAPGLAAAGLAVGATAIVTYLAAQLTTAIALASTVPR